MFGLNRTVVTSVTTKQAAPQLVLPGHYLRNLLDLAQSRGAQSQTILTAAGLALNMPEQPDATLSWPQFQEVIKLCCEQTKEPALGLYLGSQLTITTHGLLGLASMSSRNVHEALTLICKYAAMRSPLLTLSMQQQKQQVRLNLTELQPLAEVRHFVVETFAVALHALLNFVSGQQYQLQQVQFAFARPAYSELYQAFFPCPVLFDQEEHGFIFAAADLAISSPWADRQVQSQLTAQCEQELQHWQQSQSMAGLIRLMLGRTKGRIPSIEQVATEFALSSRTLRRRLAEENTQYHQLVADWRQQMAEQYLLTTGLPVQQIGYLLGYADPANFGRAFRRQYGLSPQQYRLSRNSLGSGLDYCAPEP
ncbi:AraC family transcriptional regulator [Arsukibacterium sp.]|uniref:AraC family transcriptional regulator n=1 Tax=Arsukibacterium sp. TaxID=1977258 RepID=UPI002FD93722